MEAAKELLLKLGVKNCTERHLKIIENFITSGEPDCKQLLNQLGDWDSIDLDITKQWLNNLYNGNSKYST